SRLRGVMKVVAIERSARSFQQTPGFVGGLAVAVALTQADRGLQVIAAGVAIAGLKGELAELEVRPAVNPVAPFVRQGRVQIDARLGRAAKNGPGETALVIPQRLFTEHAWSIVFGEPRDTVAQHSLAIDGAARAQQRRARLEREQPIGRILGPQRFE